jgi:DNA-binding response OmpR family regulator
MRVLVVEDDPEVREFIVRVLRETSWAADGVRDGAGCLDALERVMYDLVVLDLGLPDTDGFELCRSIRAKGNRTPILMLTARNAVNDRVAGLDAGADDYLAKPFAVSELRARLRALARRPSLVHDTLLKVADLELDVASHSVRRGALPIDLTAREFALLEYLMRHSGRVITRSQIVDNVWNDNFDPVANAVDVLVGRLRRKIDAGSSVPLVRTIRGSGYMISDVAAHRESS